MTTWEIREQREDEIKRLETKDDILTTAYYFSNCFLIAGISIALIFAFASYKTEYVDYNPGSIDWHNVMAFCGGCMIVVVIAGVASLILRHFRTTTRTKCKALRAANNGDRGLDRPW